MRLLNAKSHLLSHLKMHLRSLTLKSCGKIIHDTLLKNNVENVWLYNGGAILDVIDCFYDSKDINYYVTAHEQSLGHAATGYAKSSGKTGVVLVTSGPGLTNLITPILDATNDSTPLVVISGQVKKEDMGTLAFQECDATAITKSITKWNYCVNDIREVEAVVDTAFQIANDGKKGAVHVDLPQCIGSSHLIDESISLAHLSLARKNNIFDVSKNKIFKNQINVIMEVINKSKYPVLLVGQGCIGHSELLRDFAIKANIPVTTTLHGMGIFDETHPLSLKMLGKHGSVYSNYCIQRSDCVIALGTRFDDRTTGDVSKYAPQAEIIHVNINKNEIDKIIKTKYNVLADCGVFLQKALEKAEYKSRKTWRRYINKLKIKHPFRYHKSLKIKPQSVLVELNKQLQNVDNSIFTLGVGNHMMMACQFIDWKRPRQVIGSGSLGVMGCSIGYAIGAQIANPESMVISIDGDGSFNMTSNELKTVAEYNIPIKIAVINDESLQMMKKWQEIFFDKRYTGAENKNPDYVKLGQAHGIQSLRCDNYKDLPDIVDVFLSTKDPVLCEFKVEQDICLPLVIPGKALDEMVLFEDYYERGLDYIRKKLTS